MIEPFWFIDWTPTSTTTPCQSEIASTGNEELLHTLQSSRTGALSCDGLESYLGHTLVVESYLYTEIDRQIK